MMEKPHQSLASLTRISFGFLGIQFAFALQNGNVSRIFQSLGSSVDDLPFLWLAGPVTGLLVQPLIGHFSDRHWSRFGRRRPFFFAGAVLAALALFGFPHAGSLFAGAIFLWILDAALNISMEPFRAFVGDMTRPDQRATGYAVQTVLIGIGAVLGSLAPLAFTSLGVANTAPEGVIPDSVRYALYLGGAAIFLAVLWTVLRVREYSPEEMAAFNAGDQGDEANRSISIPTRGLIWALAGAAGLFFVWNFGLDKQLYVLGGGLLGFASARQSIRQRRKGRSGDPERPDANAKWHAPSGARPVLQLDWPVHHVDLHNARCYPIGL
jgi:maltose/moltooligosaccharide transporter